KNIGFSADNGWPISSFDPQFPESAQYNSQHYYGNSQAYRADITLMVSEYGNGQYFLSSFTKSSEVNVNGASMVVLFNNPSNKRDMFIADGNDSNHSYNY